MRIISGKYAKRNLFTLKSNRTRPTSDKVKESLFNSLGQFFQGGNVLDLYAGSGALGIEAVSRGCDHASLVDINHAACTIIKKNVALTKEEQRFNVYNMRSSAALKLFSEDDEKFDLVFLDPPYAKEKIDQGGTRTHNLWIRSPTRYPLRHMTGSIWFLTTSIRHTPFVVG